jgi:hypothetical protein
MFEIILVDLDRSNLPDNAEIFWQSELRSFSAIIDMFPTRLGVWMLCLSARAKTETRSELRSFGQQKI